MENKDNTDIVSPDIETEKNTEGQPDLKDKNYVKGEESKGDTDSLNKEEKMDLSETPNYELIDDVYYYTDESTGVHYKYDQSKEDWVESTLSDAVESVDHTKVTTDDEGRQYYWADGMYLCRDADQNIFVMDENNEWKAWSEKMSTNERKTENHWYFYKGENTFYRDNSTNKVYILKKDTNEWEEYKKTRRKRIPVNKDEEFDTDDDEESVSSEEEGDGNAPPGSQTDPSISYNGIIYTKLDHSDNMNYEWDSTKKAWFPKIDEDFMASYQLSYGFNPDGTKNENPLKFDDDDDDEDDLAEEEKKKEEEKANEKGEKPKAGWFHVDDAHNLKVYVSNLPTDMDEEGFVEFMSKCGLVYKDPATQKFKVKMYMDKEGKFKGDALCSYIKIESVELALQILDGYRLDTGTVSVERAKFTLRGEYNPSLKPKKRRKKEIEKLQKKQEKLFAWHPEALRGQRMKHENVAIFRNVFDPKEFETATEKILVHNEAIRAQAETFGSVKKVELFDRHPEGVIKVTFAEVECADMCVATLHNRLYLRRKLVVATWDGVQKYNIEETEEQRKERIKKWEEFLEGKQS